MDDEILQDFMAESWENLARLDTEIIELEKRPRDAELLASIFRTIHTIKGTCGFIGLTALGAVAHAAENVLGQMRNGELNVTASAVSLVLEAVDQIKFLLHAIEETGHEPAVNNDELNERLNSLAKAGNTSVETTPAPESASVVTGESGTTESQLEPKTLDALLPSGLEPTTAPRMNSASSGAEPPEAEAHDAPEGAKKSTVDLSIRVNVNVLDSLMNLVGELVLTRNQLLQMARGDEESKYLAPITHLNRVTTDLQEGVMKTRMQPIGNAWSKLPRLVRDLAQVTGKQLELEMSGAETELDRTVLDAIKDPLTHMVRNSADHGIELPAVRRSIGKAEVGRIRLSAYHEGGHVIIRIEDDGAGINLEKVKAKAIQQGLVSESDATRLTDSQILRFVFHAGLSTADKVSSVSGRGVGMDVVRTQIEKIGGTVDLTSSTGVGSAVKIKIPLTLAIISALVVESGGESFAIPQLGVVELVRLAAEDRDKIERIHDSEVFRLRDRLLPLVHLDHALGLEDCQPETDQDVNIVVVQVGDDQFGLIVADVFDTEEIVVKPMGSMLKDIDIYQGTTILGDGRVIMILDVAGIAAQFGGVSSEKGDADRRRDAESEAEAGNETTTLLLFDAGAGMTMSVPLSLVARLEEIPAAGIERTGDRLVVQYRGDLLPLLPIDGGESSRADADLQPVIVFSEGKNSMGLMVNQILDIKEERLMIRMHSQRPGVLGTAIISGKATDVIDTQYYLLQVNQEWFAGYTEAPDLRILIIDSSPFFRQLATTALEMENHRVVCADSTSRAIELLERGTRFDLIVADTHLPKMNGYDFAKWLRSRQTSRIPLIAMTSHGGLAEETRALQAGFDRFLLKFNAQQLTDAIAELCLHAELRTGLPA